MNVRIFEASGERKKHSQLEVNVNIFTAPKECENIHSLVKEFVVSDECENLYCL